MRVERKPTQSQLYTQRQKSMLPIGIPTVPSACPLRPLRCVAALLPGPSCKRGFPLSQRQAQSL